MANFGVIAMSGMEEQGGRKRFIAVQAAKAGIGACLALAFIALVGRPDIGEIVAIAGLLAPGALALLAFTKISLPALETASLSVFAGLIGYLVALTGGMNSPLLCGSRWCRQRPRCRAGVRPCCALPPAAALVLLAVVAVEMFHALPRSRLDLPIWQLYAGSVLAAVIQSAVVAIAAQDRQRVADRRRQKVPRCTGSWPTMRWT
jgi:cell cycle sensor histidine kinase DivJ